MRRFPQPRSLIGLILLGFMLVALPLVVAVVGAMLHVDRLEYQSRTLLQQGLEVTRHGESLSAQLVEMERNARQFQVVGDAGLRRVYQQRHDRFLETLRELGSLQVGESIRDRIDRLRAHSHAVAGAVAGENPQSEALAAALDRLGTVRSLIQEMNAEGEELIDQELESVQQAASDARRQLAVQSALAIPAALVLALIFTAIINRPIRQIRVAIRRLGRGEFRRPVRVNGPPELHAVGERLDWLRNRLQELEQEKSRFLRHMSHELKTPLASLHEGTELLLDGSTGELTPTQREVGELLRMNTIELQQMILNLLDFSAWQERTAHLNRGELEVLGLVRSVAERHRLAVAGRGIELHVTGSPLQILADRDKLRTALDNLISNAVKYSPTGGHISLRVGHEDSTAVIDVRDEGPGVPQADRERIFEPFFQGNSPHAGPVRGTGIGLSVVKECVNAHGGSVEILDSSPGAHFRIRLPQRVDV